MRFPRCSFIGRGFFPGFPGEILISQIFVNFGQVVEHSDLAFSVPYFAAQTQGAFEAGERARAVPEPQVAFGQATY